MLLTSLNFSTTLLLRRFFYTFLQLEKIQFVVEVMQAMKKQRNLLLAKVVLQDQKIYKYNSLKITIKRKKEVELR